MKHTVDSAILSAPKEVLGTYGGSVKVTCHYDLRFRNYTKYWCKGRVYELCRIVVKTPRNRWSDRSSIADDQTAGAFTITMTSLRDSDDDAYWCVIAKAGKNVNTRVRLRISHTGMTHTGSPILKKQKASLCINSDNLNRILFVISPNTHKNVFHFTIPFYFNNHYF